MKSILNIVPLVLNDKIFKYEILSTSSESVALPSIEIRSYQDINETLIHLMGLYTEDAAHRLNYKLSDVMVSEDLHIFYYCFIPFAPTLKNSFLISLKDYDTNLPNLQKILKAL
jgi:hypothetical protein